MKDSQWKIYTFRSVEAWEKYTKRPEQKHPRIYYYSRKGLGNDLEKLQSKAERSSVLGRWG